jgi:LytS/YehU family sensor histidine kinase
MSSETVGELISATRYLIIFVALVVTVLYSLSLSEKIRKFVYKQSYSRTEKLVMILLFGLLGILASEYGLKMIGVVANVRDCVALFAGILGGPAVGIGAGLISGFYRMSGVVWTGWTGTLGYWSAIGCGLATIGAGFVGAWLSKYKKINIRTVTPKQIWQISGLLFIWQVIHLQVINPIIAPLYTDKTFMWVEKTFFTKLLLPMGLANVLGILLLLFVIRDLVIKREAEVAEKIMIEAELKEREKGQKL